MGTDFLHGVEVVEVDDGIRPIRTLKSSVIGLVGIAGKGDVNTPVLVTSRRDAVTKFGAWNPDDGFTIPAALDAIFDQGGATVVVVNAFPYETSGLTSVNDETVTIDTRSGVGRTVHGFIRDVAVGTTVTVTARFPDVGNGQIVLPDGVLVTSVTGSDGTVYAEGTDYSVTANASDTTVTNLDAGIPVGAEVRITYVVKAVKDTTGTYTFSTGAGGSFTLPPNAKVTAVKSQDGATTYVLDTDYSVTAGVSGVTVTNLGAAIPDGVTVLVEWVSPALIEGTDYTLDADVGEIRRNPAGSQIMPGSEIQVDYVYVDASKATEGMIIGGTAADGSYTGVQALLASKSVLGVQPRILIAPGFTTGKPSPTTRNAVVAEMLGIADRLGAIIIKDGPNTTDEESVQDRADWGSKRVMIVDPYVVRRRPDGTGNVSTPASSVFAGIISRTDHEVGFWASPSNKLIYGIVGTHRPIEFAMGDPNSRANYLNSNEVTTILREQGFRTWGNRTTSFDQKWAFLSVVRTADMIAESIMQAHLWAVDRGITKQFFEQVVEGVNAYIRYLVGIGAIIGGRAWADPSLNTPEVVASGQVYIDYEFTPPYPAERVTFRAHLVNDYVAELFD